MNRLNPDTINFFKELEKNNNRDWFLINKERYQQIREDFVSFLSYIYPAIAEVDPSLRGIDIRKSVFRINRDVRFSEDKSPYKTTIAAVLIEGGRRNFSEQAGYYIHIEQGNSMIAGGAYLPPSPWINSIRREISSDSQTFRDIIEKSSFVELFGELTGDRLKSAPKGYPKDHPDIDLLRYRSYLAVNHVSDKEVLSEGFADHIIAVAREIKPLNDFVNSSRD
ncbi:MAG TPA: DUF2461 domain-containing protein [Bacteroidales bacterium]|nr:DUF2461 domain-containing protein [Bacteroidales bacterium]